MATTPISFLSPPRRARRFKRELRPISGVHPAVYGLNDIEGQTMTVGTAIELRSGTDFGMEMNTPASNTGLSRTGSFVGPPASFIGIARQNSASGFHCLSSLATTGDKTLRVFGNNLGACLAQQIANTGSVSATTGNIWSFGYVYIVVAVFAASNSTKCFARGNLGLSEAKSTTDAGSMPTMTNLSYGAYSGSVVNQQLDGQLIFGCWFGSVFPDAYARALLYDPWDVFEPDRRFVPIMLPSVAAANVFNPMTGRGGAAAQPLAIN